MAFIPYALEAREHKDLPEHLQEAIAESESNSLDEVSRESLLISLGLPPRDARD